MFLIEGNGKAIIYTGDIRGEFIVVFIELQLIFFSREMVGRQLDPSPRFDTIYVGPEPAGQVVSGFYIREQEQSFLGVSFEG